MCALVSKLGGTATIQSISNLFTDLTELTPPFKQSLKSKSKSHLKTIKQESDEVGQHR